MFYRLYLVIFFYCVIFVLVYFWVDFVVISVFKCKVRNNYLKLLWEEKKIIIKIIIKKKISLLKFKLIEC